MSTKEVKAQIHKQAERIESGVEDVANELGDGADAVAAQRDDLQETLREFGRHIADSLKTLTDEASRQAQQRPLAVFGVAFLAGVIAARALRR